MQHLYNVFTVLILVIFITSCSSELKGEDRETFYRGVELYSRGQADEALDQLFRLTYRYKGSAPLNTMLGKCFLHKNDYEKAVDYFERAVEAAPLSSEPLLWYGKALYLKGEIAEAALQLEKVVELDRQNLEANLLLGGIYFEEERFSEALLCYGVFDSYNESFSIGMLNMATFYSEHGQWERAVVYLKQAAAFTNDKTVLDSIDRLLEGNADR